MTMHPTRFPYLQIGFHLLEIIVSVLVLSIGITGVLKLQIVAMQTGQHVYFYSEAQLLAVEIAEIISAPIMSKARPNDSPLLKVDFQATRDQINSNQLCFQTDCNPEQLASAYLAEWLNRLTNTLPDARAKICLDDVPWDDTTNDFTWDCVATGNGASAVIKLGWAEKSDGATETAPRLILPVASQLN